MLVAGTLKIRPGEGRVVATVAGSFAAVEAGRGLGEVGVQALVLDSAGPTILPPLYIALGLVGLVATLSYGALIGRFRGVLFPASLLIIAAVIGVEGVAVLLAGDVRLFAVAWVSVFTAGALLTTVLWTVAGRIFDTRQAKRLFPLCTAATIAGGFLGLLAAGPLSQLVGVEPLIVGQAVLTLAGGLALWRVRNRLDVGRRRGVDEDRSLRAGAAYVRRSPVMRLVAIAYLLFAVLLFSMAFPFSAAMAAAFPDRADLATALGLLAAAVTAVSFLLAALVANRLYARFGVTTVALLLPLVYLGGFGIWLIAFTTVTAIGVKFAQEATQRGLSNTVWSALFTVVPSARRGQVLAFIDGVPGQLGTVLTGALLLGAATVGVDATSRPLFALGAAAAVACLWTVVLVRRRYPAALLATLREGPGEQVLEGGPGLAALALHPGMAAQLRTALQSDRPSDRRLAVELSNRLDVRDVVIDVVPLVDDPEPSVRRAALATVGRHGHPAALDAIAPGAIDRLALDEDPRIRAELALALSRWQRIDEGHSITDALLRSEQADDRAAGLRVVAELRGDQWSEQLIAALSDDAPTVRTAAANALVNRPDLTARVLRTLLSGPEVARDAALAALDGDDPLVRDTLVPWALDSVTRATTLRQQAADVSTKAGESATFLSDLLRRRSATIENRLLRVLAILGAPEAVGPIRRCLHSGDAETRAQAIEALDALGSGPLARAVVRLIDSEPGSGPASDAEATSILHRLTEYPDLWVRALALRTLSEDRAGGAAMPDGRTVRDDLDRMLLLRRVPLFSMLEPEDLQRVSAAAVERTYAAGEALMNQGDVGDELIVIVEGTVDVVQQDGNGSRRFIRSYGAGDHIGELAVLRQGIRVATVLADERGARGLVLNGGAVQAILRERPDAAMAMLATLAERISTQ